jgi:cell shape-determining protein MreC
MNYLKVEGQNNLLRDPRTNSIVNNNMSEYQQYIKRRELKKEENQKVQNLEEDVASMKDDLNEIKSLLRSLVNGSE